MRFVFARLHAHSLAFNAGMPTSSEPSRSSGTTRTPQSPCPRRVSSFGRPPSGAHSVLYLILDDWSHVPLALTPHLNQLAASGLTFDSAYAQAAHCVPSRNSFLSGRSPETTRVVGAKDRIVVPHDGSGRDRETTYERQAKCGESWTSLPEHFHSQGWYVLGGGKIFHGRTTNTILAQRYHPSAESYLLHTYGSCPRDGCEIHRMENSGRSEKGAVDFCVVDDDVELFDELLAEGTILHLNGAVHMQRSRGRPFMVMAGFVRPHAPWVVPRRKWLELSRSDVLDACSAYQTTFSATHAEMIGCHRSPPSWMVPEQSTNNTCSFVEKDLHQYRSCGSPIDVSMRLGARRSYFASVAFVDEQVGRVLSHLEVLNQTEQTLVVVHSDHGFHLGENGLWTKFTNYELATRVPLIMRAPWLPRGGSGERVSLLVELLDLYPTMAKLAGAPQPAGPAEVAWPLEGKDVSVVFSRRLPLQQPTEGPHVAYSQFPRCSHSGALHSCGPPWPSCSNVCDDESTADGPMYMGYAARTYRFRYIAWMHWINGSALWGTPPVVEELYDFQSAMQSRRRALEPQNSTSNGILDATWGGPSRDEWLQRWDWWATRCPRVYETEDLSKSPSYATAKHFMLELVRKRFARPASVASSLWTSSPPNVPQESGSGA